MDFYHQDILTLEMIVEKTSHNVAKRFQIKDRGYIREGYFADLAILDLDQPYRVSKDNIRIRAYGTVDELNSILGVVKHHVSKKLIKVIAEIQNDLFDLGADLANPITKSPKFPPLRITENQVKRLESTIDKFNKPLSSLNSFILPDLGCRTGPDRFPTITPPLFFSVFYKNPIIL